MNIFMWSGPRNLSTALMRSFENRDDTDVWDEPLYAYYLNETKKNHPLKEKIIDSYETNIDKLIISISKKLNNNKILFQKHMTHHILKKTPLDWITKGINCFLIRDPKDVLLSYAKKNTPIEADDLGFPSQKKLFNLIKNFNLPKIVINADDLSNNPKYILKVLCNKLNIKFDEKMLKWPQGSRDTDGLWSEVWYKNVNSSMQFYKLEKDNTDIPKKYESIYTECLKIYEELNSYRLKI